VLFGADGLDRLGLIDIRRLNLGSARADDAQHQAILDAIGAGDPATARVAMAAHLEGVAAWWRENLAPEEGAGAE
jgi:DNA-binding FadR family transcriptional regulator